MLFWLCHNFFVSAFFHPTYGYGVEFEVEYYDAKGWNLVKDVNNLLKSINSLNEKSSIDEISKTVASFKNKLDRIYYTGLSTEEVFDLVLTQLAESGVYLKKSELEPFIKMVKRHSKHKKSLSSEFGSFDARKGKDKKDEKDENQQIDMNMKSLLGCVTIFCGLLLCILPFPQIKAIGAGLIAEGTREVIMGYAEENDKKKKSPKQCYIEDFSFI